MGNSSSAAAVGDVYGEAHGDYEDARPDGLTINEADLRASAAGLHAAYDKELAAYLPHVLPQGLDTRVCYSADFSKASCEARGGMYGSFAQHPLLARLREYVDRVGARTQAAMDASTRMAKRLGDARADLDYLRRLLAHIKNNAGRASELQATLKDCEERVKAAQGSVADAQGQVATAEAEVKAAQAELKAAQAELKAAQAAQEETGETATAALAGGDAAYRMYQALVEAKPLRAMSNADLCLRTYPRGSKGEDAAFAEAQTAGLICAPSLLGVRVMGPITRALRARTVQLHAAEAAKAQAAAGVEAAMKEMAQVRDEIHAALAAAGLSPEELATLKAALAQVDDCSGRLTAVQETLADLHAKLRAAHAAAAEAKAAAARAQAAAAEAKARQEAKRAAKATADAEHAAKAKEAKEGKPPAKEGKEGKEGKEDAEAAAAVVAALAGASASDKQAAARTLLQMIKDVVANGAKADVARQLEGAKAAVPAVLQHSAAMAAQNVLFLRNFTNTFFAAVYGNAADEQVKAKDEFFKRADAQSVMLTDAAKRALIVSKALTFDGVGALVSRALQSYMMSAGMRRLLGL